MLQIVCGWKKIPDTYFHTLGAEDAMQFHREVCPRDRLGKVPSARKPRGRNGQISRPGRL